MGDPIAAQELSSLSLNDAVSPTHVPNAEFSDRVPIRSIISRPDGGSGLTGQKARIGGWVKTGRKADKDAFAFLELNDGTSAGNLQVIVEASVYELGELVAMGTCVVVDGLLKIPPSGTRQRVELRVEKVIHVGPVDPAKYPLPKTKLTLEFLRDFVHLRSRTNTISAVARIRNALAFATHTFFNKHGFRYVHTPIITTREGTNTEADVEAAKLLVKEKWDIVSQLKAAKASKQEIGAAVVELKKAKDNVSKLSHMHVLLVVYIPLDQHSVLVPKVGELIGGSQREERLDVIQQRLRDIGLPPEPYEWYLDLRRFGTVQHAGFGLGFERMIIFATGLENIRDVIPFPRYPGRADL
ncbi:hypothetical protein TanjilG_20664 [Lupinus angustifolius]|uniref:Aminoacyl-transfer RNA synthetases class-II family profile domain-containing protein n=1 Tax=Lupinus angustifolius TaxID=3871 RepID=A0A4P1QRF8_LUPAN|nr:hypothetical protein TanjilG_20664 [Lupinus angustifolius]